MTESSARQGFLAADDDVSLATVATILLRSWRRIVMLGVLGGLLGLAMGLTSRRVFLSSATFIPQGSGSEAGGSGLAAAVSQLGLRIPSGGGTTWSPAVYVELLGSPVLLEEIARDTLVVVEQQGRSIALMDLLNISAETSIERTDATIRALGNVVSANEVRTLGAVKLSVVTPWPSVSLALAQHLMRGVNTFNIEMRKSQASAERQFVEGQARDAETALREAETHLQEFLQRNRVISGSPELGLEHDRLQRDVTLRQQVYLSLLQSREEARIREVRDTPVITVLEYPRLALVSEPRKSIQKALVGGVMGGVLAVFLAFIMDRLAKARLSSDPATRELFELMENAMPRFLWRSW